MKDIVAGLELYMAKGRYGLYIKCGVCGATLDNEVVRERISADQQTMVALAIAEGWDGGFSRTSFDICPSCSGKLRKEAQ